MISETFTDVCCWMMSRDCCEVDCGNQAARECMPWKSDYAAFTQCAEKERQFCESFGAFDGEKYPNFKYTTRAKLQRAQEVVQYCGNLFQWRGLKLSCMRSCTVFTMRMTRPDDYFRWRAKVRLREYRGMSDPSESMASAPENGAFNECENQALALCRWLRRDFWRECYEREKMKCLRLAGTWSPMFSD